MMLRGVKARIKVEFLLEIDLFTAYVAAMLSRKQIYLSYRLLPDILTVGNDIYRRFVNTNQNVMRPCEK